jgi:ATP-dependent exoDNAse (exonuclease V) beta subunit
MPETEEGRHIGSLVHAYLERIAVEGLDLWPVERAENEGQMMIHRLGRMGIAEDRLTAAAEKVVLALSKTLQSRRGRWILFAHQEAACELSLSGVVDGRMVHAEIDRTFVDDKGVRWIVDYKTGDSKGSDEDTFMRQQAQIYQGQLELYVRLMQAMEPSRVMRTALYFPLLDGWITL